MDFIWLSRRPAISAAFHFKSRAFIFLCCHHFRLCRVFEFCLVQLLFLCLRCSTLVLWKMNMGFHFLTLPIFLEDTHDLSTIEESASILPIHSLPGLNLMSTRPSCHFFCSIPVSGVVSEKSRRPVRSRTGLSACCIFRNTPVTRSDNIVSALATTALLDLHYPAKTDSTAMPCSVQAWNELAVSQTIFQVHYLLVTITFFPCCRMIPRRCNRNVRNGWKINGIKFEYYLDNNWFLEAQNKFIWENRMARSQCWEKICVQLTLKKRSYFSQLSLNRLEPLSRYFRPSNVKSLRNDGTLAVCFKFFSSLGLERWCCRECGCGGGSWELFSASIWRCIDIRSQILHTFSWNKKGIFGAEHCGRAHEEAGNRVSSLPAKKVSCP